MTALYSNFLVKAPEVEFGDFIQTEGEVEQGSFTFPAKVSIQTDGWQLSVNPELWVITPNDIMFLGCGCFSGDLFPLDGLTLGEVKIKSVGTISVYEFLNMI
jgi:hypothetical protein